VFFTVNKFRKKYMNSFENKRVLITGACGTVGHELTSQMVNIYKPKETICIDNNESEMFFLEQKFSRGEKTSFFIADIKDQSKLSSLMNGVDIVFHTAAYKHVILCERSPFEAVKTNILGVENVIQAAIKNNVEKVIFTSSDKAVNPTSVMGTSKLMGERLMTAANKQHRGDKPIFSTVRFGNVLGSRGSVIPIFKKQIEAGGPITITDNEMTRFIMTIEQSVQLVIEASKKVIGGEVFITKMPVINIADLAKVMIDVLAPEPDDIKIEIIGAKAGEKLYEELMSDEECRRTIELENFFAVKPAYDAQYKDVAYEYDEPHRPVTKPYNSSIETKMTQEELKKFLIDVKILEEKASFNPDKRFWPDK